MSVWRKENFTVRLPYSSANEKFSNPFVNKIEEYTNGEVK